MDRTRREEALELASELLADIELARLTPVDIARKTSRLARLLDDAEAMRWLRYETSGYPASGLGADGTGAAIRSNREAGPGDDGLPRYWTGHLSSLQADADSARTELSHGSETSHSEYAAIVERQKAERHAALRVLISRQTELVQRIVAAFYDYASSRYQELRFGAAIGTAFDVVRTEVDTAIGALVPDALPKLSAAFENTTSENPEDWASAAATCRRLLKAAADALRPPGPEKNGRAMDDEHYLNRLIDWITTLGTSETTVQMITADLEYLGRRLDAVLDAGHKGAHAEVTRFDASRFVTGTYLLLGDVLRLHRA